MGYSTADLELLRRFARTPEGRIWVELLTRKLAEADAALRTSIGEELYRRQGRAQQLFELIEDLTKAEQRAEQREKRSMPRALMP